MSAPRSILLFDAQADDRRLARLVLERELGQVSCTEAGLATDLAPALASDEWGSIVCEWTFPWAAPGEVARALRERFPHTPIVILTAAPADAIAPELPRLGADAFLGKTSRGFVDLAGTLREATFRSRRRQTAPRDHALRAVVDGLTTGVFSTDSEGVVVDANPALARLLGLAGPEETVGRTLESLLKTPAAAAAWRSLVDGSSREIDQPSELEAGEGRRRWVRVAARSVRTGPVESRLLIGTVEDLTASRDLGVELERQRNAHERAAADLEQFASVVSHDLRQPLTAVRRFLRLLDEEAGKALQPEARQYLTHALDGSESLHRMLDAVLGYARVTTHGRDFAPTDLSLVLDRVLRQLEPVVRSTGAEVTCDHLPTVAADAAQMEQLFVNLLGNALKFHGAEQPRIRVSAARDERCWRVTVEDEGIGVPREAADRIFEMFYRANGSADYPGSGVGLAICQRIAARHGGRIWVDTERPRGAAFHVALPPTSEEAIPP